MQPESMLIKQLYLKLLFFFKIFGVTVLVKHFANNFAFNAPKSLNDLVRNAASIVFY